MMIRCFYFRGSPSMEKDRRHPVQLKSSTLTVPSSGMARCQEENKLTCRPCCYMELERQVVKTAHKLSTGRFGDLSSPCFLRRISLWYTIWSMVPLELAMRRIRARISKMGRNSPPKWRRANWSETCTSLRNQFSRPSLRMQLRLFLRYSL